MHNRKLHPSLTGWWGINLLCREPDRGVIGSWGCHLRLRSHWWLLMDLLEATVAARVLLLKSHSNSRRFCITNWKLCLWSSEFSFGQIQYPSNTGKVHIGVRSRGLAWPGSNACHHWKTWEFIGKSLYLASFITIIIISLSPFIFFPTAFLQSF